MNEIFFAAHKPLVHEISKKYLNKKKILRLVTAVQTIPVSNENQKQIFFVITRGFNQF